jgi:CRP-like cAMP-binding protein
VTGEAVSFVTDHPFLRGIDAAPLIAAAHRERFAAGSFVFHMNGPADALYLVERGRVVLEMDEPGRGPTQLEEIGPGDLLGISWLFPPKRWQLDARAVEETEATVLPAAGLRNAIDTDAQLGRALALRLIAELYQRLTHTRLQRLDVYRGAR